MKHTASFQYILRKKERNKKKSNLIKYYDFF